MYDPQQHPEGRFGFELQRTRDIFFAATPKSLVVLDELAEGTTQDERIDVSRDVMEGFQRLGSTTVLATHNYELIEWFRQQGGGQYWQVEFAGEEPTHRIVEGISHTSHAKRVAKKIGFSRADIDTHLSAHGHP
jgi:DNA mismatch repair ATPase MutS